MSRHHVHLSIDVATALAVGGRRGRPIVLEILARRMQEDGFSFYVATNGVWLTECVPPEYIRFDK
jgi:putative RNA 2'-phosphotransferase